MSVFSLVLLPRSFRLALGSVHQGQIRLVDVGNGVPVLVGDFLLLLFPFVRTGVEELERIKEQY